MLLLLEVDLLIALNRYRVSNYILYVLWLYEQLVPELNFGFLVLLCQILVLL